MKKVLVVGHFGFGKKYLDGQTIKTKIITDELENQLGENNVSKIDTHGNKFRICLSVLKTVIGMFVHKNIIILPAHNGIKIFIPLLSIFKNITKCKTHYIVIGGWLPEFISNKRNLIKSLKNIDCIYVETKLMKSKLNSLGFENIYIMSNCKNLKILKEDELVYNDREPYRFCTFSRVMKEKGIEDAIEAVKNINRENNRTICTLDIYGQIDNDYKERFEEIQSILPDYIKYKGLVDFDKTTDVLKNYFALLFPTYYDGEGFAGTVIDAYAAGIPVIATDWRYNNEVVKNNMTGIIYPNKEVKNLKNAIEYIINNFSNSFKTNCSNEAKKYLPHNVLPVLYAKLK